MSDLSGKYKVHLGGRDRGLRYTMEDRDQLERLFPRPDGTPNDIITILGHLDKGAYAVQTAILWVGLKRVDSRINLPKVKEWLTKHISEGSELRVIYNQVFKATMFDGITGKSIDVDDIDAPVDEGEEAEPPKAKGAQPKS